MKIGIITFNSAHNYGAVLQVWALQEKLRGEGHEVEVINYRIPAIDNLYRVFVPKRVSKKAYVNRACHKLQHIKARIRIPEKTKRYDKFETFIQKILPTTVPYRNYGELRRAELNYDILIAGSDQIWNGGLTKGINPAYFLAFGNKDAKRVSYAASIGKDCFDEEEKTLVQRYLKNFDYISVREEKAKASVEELTSKPVELVLDPTLLLERERYDKLKKDSKIKQDYIFVHNVHLAKIDERLNAMVEEVSKRTGWGVVNNRADYQFTNEIGKFTTGGPKEFLGMIAGAKMVITNSFHATVFSLIYEREFITIPHFKNPDRMRHLLHLFQVDEHLIGDVKDLPEDLNSIKIDYTKVAKLRKEARITSEEFLKTALSGEKTTGKPVEKEELYLHSKDIYSCYGCEACMDSCPKGAITMEVDEEGFQYPVVTDENAFDFEKFEQVCICGKGKSLKENKEKAVSYAAYAKDDAIHETSTNGGVFGVIANYGIDQGWKIAGVRTEEDGQVAYGSAQTKEECAAFRGVKFVEPDTNGIKPKVKELLEQGETVVFSGTPCQIAAVKSFLGKDYANLYTIENICNGLPSRKAYYGYLGEIEQEFSSKIKKMDVSNKVRGAAVPYMCVEFENEELWIEAVRNNPFMLAKNAELLQRPSCYTCEFTLTENSVADITLGARAIDENTHAQGENVVRLNTQKGKQLWQKVKDVLVYEEIAEVEQDPAKHIMRAQRNQLLSKMEDDNIKKTLTEFTKVARRTIRENNRK